eukprot:gb/GFBE01039052.1/.p1 GENE.gb/GFBE01039052.1/~~gb/GFBE01039052.1/.p1  ORF type:complete len:423 (+),score=107.98 gb/GFBE01039052.1/:1-1269(+)
MADETRKLLREGAAELLKEGSGFDRLRRGIVRAQAGGDVSTEVLLGEMQNKEELLKALLGLFAKRKILRRQIAYAIRLLVEGSPEWAAIWQKADVTPEVVAEAGIPHGGEGAPAATEEEEEEVPEASPKAADETEAVEFGTAAPAPAPKVPGAQLKKGLAELEAIQFDCAARRAAIAFRWLSRGVTETGADEILDAFESKEATMLFLLDLHGLKRLYREKVARCLATVLKRPSWVSVAAKSDDLQQRLPDHLQLQQVCESVGDESVAKVKELKDAGQALRRTCSSIVQEMEQVKSGTETEVAKTDVPAKKVVEEDSDSDSDAEVVDTPEAVAERNDSEARSKALALIADLAKPELAKHLEDAGVELEKLDQILADYLEGYEHLAERKIGRKSRTWASISEGNGLAFFPVRPFVRMRVFMHKI